MFLEFPWKMTMEQRLCDNTKVIKLARKKKRKKKTVFLSLQSAFFSVPMMIDVLIFHIILC